MECPSSELLFFPTDVDFCANFRTKLFATMFAPIFDFLMELEFKLEWLEGVAQKSGGLAPPQIF